MPVIVAIPRQTPSPCPATTKSFMFVINLRTYRPMPKEING